MNGLKWVQNPYVSLSINLAYAIGNCIIGFLSQSWWFITTGAYYAVLAAARFCIMNTACKMNEHADAELFTKRTTGMLLIMLSVCLIGINILSAVKERGTRHHEIIMITIALYSFSKLTFAVIGMIKAKQCASPIIKTLRNVSLADSVVSIYSLQRSMLVSFPGMLPSEIQQFNILTGTAVWIIVLFLGLNLLGGKHINKAKSRIAEIHNKIAETVTEGYKKIEQHVVGGYTKIEDKFVDAYLTREGESVEEAKERLRKENK